MKRQWGVEKRDADDADLIRAKAGRLQAGAESHPKTVLGMV